MKTVFILGAGASHHLDYPLGEKLVEDIINIFQPPDEFRWHGSDIGIFKNALKRSGLSSIDAFLEKADQFFNSEQIKYLDIGRVAIAQCLIQIEDSEKLVDRGKRNWYRYLWNRIRGDIQKLTNGSISFITFNYDLSLEQFFYQAVQYTRYGHTVSKERRSELSAIVKNIPIIHVYGKLGYLDWQKELQSSRSYGEVDDLNIWEVSKEIKIIRETDGVTFEFLEAQKLLEQADQVFFLGFGYDSINLQRLDVSNKIKAPQIKRIGGTAMGLGESERRNIKSTFCKNVRPALKLGGTKEDIEDFLKNYLEEI